MSNKKKGGVYYAYVFSEKKGITKCSYSYDEIEDVCKKAGKAPTFWARVRKDSYEPLKQNS